MEGYWPKRIFAYDGQRTRRFFGKTKNKESLQWSFDRFFRLSWVEVKDYKITVERNHWLQVFCLSVALIRKYARKFFFLFFWENVFFETSGQYRSQLRLRVRSCRASWGQGHLRNRGHQTSGKDKILILFPLHKCRNRNLMVGFDLIYLRPQSLAFSHVLKVEMPSTQIWFFSDLFTSYQSF